MYINKYNKYLTTTSNNNIRFIFYKNTCLCIIDLIKNNAYIEAHDLKKNSIKSYLEDRKYNIKICYDINNIINTLKL